jgi:ATP-dependent DNA helicase RecG
VKTNKISQDDALALIGREEGHFWDFKSADITGAKLQDTVVAMLNADGGEILVGVRDAADATGISRWVGFPTEEAANQLVQTCVQDIVPGPTVHMEFLHVAGHESAGKALHLRIHRSASVHRTSGGKYKLRKGAQNLSLTPEQAQDLRLAKGVVTFEDQAVGGYTASELEQEAELGAFLSSYAPRHLPATFVRRERLIRASEEGTPPTYAAVLLFSENPSPILPKKAAVKIARYATTEAIPTREHLRETKTVEGFTAHLIRESVAEIKKLVESVSVMGPSGLEKAKYPSDAIKEIVVNAIIHRDYNISDDIHILIFDNRIEIKSPGILPGHITVANMFDERFARNPKIVRILSRYPDAPNKDIGEGLRTAFQRMREVRLKDPTVEIRDNSVVVTLPHEFLASPEDAVIAYLDHHDRINNSTGRRLTGIGSENAMKDVFYRLRDRGIIELFAAGGSSYWKKRTDIQQTNGSGRRSGKPATARRTSGSSRDGERATRPEGSEGSEGSKGSKGSKGRHNFSTITDQLSNGSVSGSKWYFRILWALEWVASNGSGYATASELARVLTDRGGLPVPATNAARAIRSMKEQSWWSRYVNERSGHYKIRAPGKKAIRAGERR